MNERVFDLYSFLYPCFQRDSKKVDVFEYLRNLLKFCEALMNGDRSNLRVQL